MDSKVSDLSFLSHFTSGNTAMMKQLVNVFFQTSTDSVGKIKNEIAAGNWKRVGAIAHSLKPQLNYMGIKTAEPLVLALEEDAEKENAAELIPGKFDAMSKIIDQAVAELKLEIEKLN